MKRMKELEDENRRHKKMYAEEKIKAKIVKEALEKKVVKPSHRREMAKLANKDFSVSICISCNAFGISESCYRYQAKLSTENAEIADWLLRLSTSHKRVYWIYRELELNLRIMPRKRIKRDKPEALSVNQVWSMDFIPSGAQVSDTLNDGRSIRTFNVIDDFNRKGLGIDVDLSLPSARVIRSLG